MDTGTTYPLDNSAIVHLAVNNPRTTNTFRLSIYLREQIDPEILQKASDRVCPRFPTIAAGIAAGFFAHRVVPMSRPVQVQPENGLLKGMTASQIRRTGVRIIYQGNRISVEIFHSLTDGYGGWHFLKALAAEYLRLSQGLLLAPEACLITPELPMTAEEWEDSFLIHAGGKKTGMVHVPSYQIQPQSPDAPGIHYTTLILPVQALLTAARAHQATITTLLTAVMASSVMELQKQRENSGMPVAVMVPIDLRRRFPSRSLRNFSLYALPQMQPEEETLPLMELVDRIRRQLVEQLSDTQLRAMITGNVSIQRNPLLKWIPLKLKCTGIRLGYRFFGSGNSSISFSNLGPLLLPEDMKPHILRADCTLTPRIGGTYNSGAISCGDWLYLNISRNCAQPELERIFIRRLQELGLEFQTEADGQLVDTALWQ